MVFLCRNTCFNTTHTQFELFLAEEIVWIYTYTKTYQTNSETHKPQCSRFTLLFLSFLANKNTVAKEQIKVYIVCLHTFYRYQKLRFFLHSNVLLMIVINCELSQINQLAKLFVQAEAYHIEISLFAFVCLVLVFAWYTATEITIHNQVHERMLQ